MAPKRFPAANVAPGSASLPPELRTKFSSPPVESVASTSVSEIPPQEQWQTVQAKPRKVQQNKANAISTTASSHPDLRFVQSEPADGTFRTTPPQHHHPLTVLIFIDMNTNISEKLSRSGNRNRNREANDQQPTGGVRQRGNPKIWNYFRESKEFGQGFPSEDWLSIPEVPTADEVLECAGNSITQGNQLQGAWASQNTYLSAHYELFREEAVRPLREAVNFMKRHPTYQELGQQSHNIGVYDGVHVCAVTFATKGLGIRISFSLSRVGKNIRWEQSKRLISGSLVALTPVSDMFRSQCVVAVVAARPLDLVRQHQIDIFVKPGDMDLDADVEWLMVEERSSFFEAQRHTLVALQKLTREPFPLSEYFVGVRRTVQPPQYVIQQPQMDLSVVFAPTPDNRAYEFENVDVIRDFPTEAPTLDDSQLNALKRILTKRLALVQGPPGTGKTHVSVMAIKAMLANYKFGDPPIVVACQTNHALDQILRLISQFESNFARLGGRSKEQGYIKERTLFMLRQSDRGKAPGPRRKNLRSQLEKLRREMCEMLRPLISSSATLQPGASSQPDTPSLQGVLDHQLLCKHGLLSQAQCDSLERGDTQWTNHAAGASDVPLKQWLGAQLITINRSHKTEDLGFEFEDAELESEELQEIEAEALDEDDEWDRLRGETVTLLDDVMARIDQPLNDNAIRGRLQDHKDLWKIKKKERGAIFEYLRRELKARITAKIRQKTQAYHEAAAEYRISGWEDDWVLLRNQKIIGMTTTGLSKYRPLIASLDPKVVLIEEAAETLEAPVTVACLPTLEHLILVGDHKQLRPQCAVKELEMETYSLNVSLFERLVMNDVEFSILQRQRRMIPEVRRILRPIYGDDIIDHPSVYDRPPVPGMGNINSYFFTHEWPETKDEQASATNELEAQMVVEFFSYLVYNGMPAEKITILTFYNGQRRLLLKKLKAHINLRSSKPSSKIVTVDSYQGEENDVILLSLVRSNSQGAIGFLNVDNRVCVALSRAKCGFYLFGNGEVLASSNSKIWHQVIGIMSGKKKPFPPKGTERRRLGFALPLTCIKHNEQSLIEDPDELGRLHGGCDQPCPGTLPCGHQCPLLCHPFSHEQVNCSRDCNRVLDCGHRCLGKCGDHCFCEQCEDFQGRLEPRQYPRGRPSSSGSGSGSTPASNTHAWQNFAAGGHIEHDAMLNRQAAENVQVQFERRLAQLKAHPVPKADMIKRMSTKTPSPPPEDSFAAGQLTLTATGTWTSKQSMPTTLRSDRYQWTDDCELDGGVMSPQPTPTPTPQRSVTSKTPSTVKTMRVVNGPVEWRSVNTNGARTSDGFVPPHMRTKSQESQTWIAGAEKQKHEVKAKKPKKEELLIDFDD